MLFLLLCVCVSWLAVGYGICEVLFLSKQGKKLKVSQQLAIVIVAGSAVYGTWTIANLIS